MAHRERIEWCDIWVEAADESPLSRALLIGDSITRSYYPHVARHLAGRFSCARIASSKCVTDPVFVKELELVLGEYEFSIIHFNNGLHGWDYDEGAYASGLSQALDYLGEHTRTGRLIWGSTTPVWRKGDQEALDPKTERVRARNQIAAELAADRLVQTNDLFEEVIDHPEIFSDDGVHFIEEGQKILGACVSRAILEPPGNSAALL